MAASKSKLVVYAASIGNALVALTKFAAAAWTGSSAMLSEAIHSLVDTGNQLLLLYGIHRAARPPDDLHPLGYGREIYFWSFVVALLMFTLGAGVACYEGVQHILSPHEIVDPKVSYIVLACAALFEGTSWIVALREFRKAKGDLGYFEAVQRSKDPLTFTVLFEDSAALIGLLIAFLGTFFSTVWECRRSMAPPPSESACCSAAPRWRWHARARDCCSASRRAAVCGNPSWPSCAAHPASSAGRSCSRCISRPTRWLSR